MKSILTLSTLFLLLSFTSVSQTITVENNKLCFDSAAAVEVYKTIIDRESLSEEIEVYQEAFDSYDTLVKEKDKLINLYRLSISGYEQQLQIEKASYEKQLADNKKQKRKMIISFSSVIALLSMLLFR